MFNKAQRIGVKKTEPAFGIPNQQAGIVKGVYTDDIIGAECGRILRVSFKLQKAVTVKTVKPVPRGYPEKTPGILSYGRDRRLREPLFYAVMLKAVILRQTNRGQQRYNNQ